MKKILIMICITLCYIPAFTQQCTDENVHQLPGKWKRNMKGASDHSATDMVKEKAFMDNITQTIRTNLTWSPAGGEIGYGNVYSIRGLDYRPRPVISICNQYESQLVYQRYYCSNGKVFLDDYIIEVKATINDLPFVFSETFFKSKKDKLGYDIEEDPETDMYQRIPSLPVVKNGVIEFEKTIFGASTGGDITTKFCILTKPGQLPYSVMSKKEYYEKWKIQHNRTIAEYENDKIKMASRGTVDKNYIASKDQDILIQRNYISKIDRVLNSKTAAELAAPALDNEGNGDYYDAGTKEFNMYYIIKPNLAYYNNKLPKSSPQVITISFRYKCTTDKYGDKLYADEAFYNELQRIKIMDLLTAKLQPLLEQ